MSECVCVCVCVRASVCVRACLCVCVCVSLSEIAHISMFCLFTNTKLFSDIHLKAGC